MSCTFMHSDDVMFVTLTYVNVKVKTASFGNRVKSSVFLKRVLRNEWQLYSRCRQRATLVSVTSWAGWGGVGGGGGVLSSALRVDSGVSSIQSHSSVSDMGANSSNVSSLFLLTCVERCRIANHALFNPAHNGHVGLHYRRYCGAQSITFRN